MESKHEVTQASINESRVDFLNKENAELRMLVGNLKFALESIQNIIKEVIPSDK